MLGGRGIKEGPTLIGFQGPNTINIIVFGP